MNWWQVCLVIVAGGIVLVATIAFGLSQLLSRLGAGDSEDYGVQ